MPKNHPLINLALYGLNAVGSLVLLRTLVGLTFGPSGIMQGLWLVYGLSILLFISWVPRLLSKKSSVRMAFYPWWPAILSSAALLLGAALMTDRSDQTNGLLPYLTGGAIWGSYIYASTLNKDKFVGAKKVTAETLIDARALMKGVGLGVLLVFLGMLLIFLVMALAML